MAEWIPGASSVSGPGLVVGFGQGPPAELPGEMGRITAMFPLVRTPMQLFYFFWTYPVPAQGAQYLKSGSAAPPKRSSPILGAREPD